MIKQFLCSLFIVVLATVAICAQDNTPKHSYSKWAASALKDGISKNVKHNSLSVSVEQKDASSIELEFYSVGQFSNLDLNLHMVKTKGDGAIEARQEPISASQKIENPTQQSSSVSEMKVIVPNIPGINGIEIVWTLDVDGDKREVVFLVPITSSKEAYTVGVVPNKELAGIRAPLCPLICWEVSGSNERCGFFYKCCGSSSGNTINFTACSVSCGMECPI